MKSKLGIYVINCGDLAVAWFERAKPVLAVSMDHNPDYWRQVKAVSPGTFVLGRYYVDEGEQRFDSPGADADWFFGLVRPHALRMHALYDAWMGYNEPKVSHVDAAIRLSQWTVRFAELMHALGTKVAAYAFGEGNPEPELWWVLAKGLADSDYLCLHEYDAPDMRRTETWRCLRYRRALAALPAELRDKPIVIGECGIDGGVDGVWRPREGWRKFGDAAHYMESLKWYDAELQKDAQVLGAAVFAARWDQGQGSYDVADLAELRDYIAMGGPAPTPPQPAPEPTLLSDVDAAQLIANAGFADPVLALAVMMAENPVLNPLATNSIGNNPSTSVDRGLWQFNSHWHAEVADACAFDPACSTREALRVSRGGTDWSQWTAFTHGSYLHQMQRAAAALAALDPTPLPPSPGPAPTRPPTVPIIDANREHVLTFPRPLGDNGRGMHFGLDCRQKDLDLHLPLLAQMRVKWVLFYTPSPDAARLCAERASLYGMMALIRPKTRIDEVCDWGAYARALSPFPAYIQIYNEPGDAREWKAGKVPPDFVSVWAARWRQAAADVVASGGYPGLQAMDPSEFEAALSGLDPAVAQRVWVSAHSYGSNHPLGYPYDARNQQDHAGATIFDDDLSQLRFLADAAWAKSALGFVPPVIVGEGGYLYQQQEDDRYPRIDEAMHAQMNVAMYEQFRAGVLANGEPLPDYLFAICPWLWSHPDWTSWFAGIDGTRERTIAAVKSMPAFERQFSGSPSPQPPAPAPPVPSTLATALKAAAAKQVQIRINVDAWLYKKAQGYGWGYPMTNEFEFVDNGTAFVGQEFWGGWICIRKGDIYTEFAFKK